MQYIKLFIFLWKMKETSLSAMERVTPFLDLLHQEEHGNISFFYIFLAFYGFYW